MPVKKDLFPLGIAKGPAFCNRETERKILGCSMLDNTHTVVMAPRRYGKTSLIHQTLCEYNLPYFSLDFLLATDAGFVKNAIQNGASTLLSKLLPNHKTTKKKLLDRLTKFHPKLTIKLLGQEVALSINQPPERSIVEILLGMDKVAESVEARGIVVFDEFQQIGSIKNNEIIEAAIRHAVERSTNITYIFSGSNRNLLNQMFSQKSRPLYHLCELMSLDRIKAPDYEKFINAQAKLKWHKKIESHVLNEIFALTECHPYYMNALCRQLWKEEEIPGRNTVQTTWDNFINKQLPWIVGDISDLTTNQRSIIIALACEPTQEPTGGEFLERVRLVSSSMKRSLDILFKKDLIYKANDGYYRVLDPAIANYIRNSSYFEME